MDGSIDTENTKCHILDLPDEILEIIFIYAIASGYKGVTALTLSYVCSRFFKLIQQLKVKRKRSLDAKRIESSVEARSDVSLFGGYESYTYIKLTEFPFGLPWHCNSSMVELHIDALWGNCDRFRCVLYQVLSMLSGTRSLKTLKLSYDSECLLLDTSYWIFKFKERLDQNIPCLIFRGLKRLIIDIGGYTEKTHLDLLQYVLAPNLEDVSYRTLTHCYIYPYDMGLTSLVKMTRTSIRNLDIYNGSIPSHVYVNISKLTSLKFLRLHCDTIYDMDFRAIRLPLSLETLELYLMTSNYSNVVGFGGSVDMKTRTLERMLKMDFFPSSLTSLTLDNIYIKWLVLPMLKEKLCNLNTLQLSDIKTDFLQEDDIQPILDFFMFQMRKLKHFRLLNNPYSNLQFNLFSLELGMCTTLHDLRLSINGGGLNYLNNGCILSLPIYKKERYIKDFCVCKGELTIHFHALSR